MRLHQNELLENVISSIEFNVTCQLNVLIRSTNLNSEMNVPCQNKIFVVEYSSLMFFRITPSCKRKFEGTEVENEINERR
jgi:hypothetical protein